MADDASDLFGKPAPRMDGAAKVTGQARYASDEPVAHPAYAYLVTSTIARGRVRAMRLERARAVPGVLDILNHANVGGQAKTPAPFGGGKDGVTTTLETDQVWHDGQIIAVVVAETFEAAREAAHRVEVDYDAQTPSATFGSPGTKTEPRKPQRPGSKDPAKGDAASAFAAAPVRIDARYSTPTQHHNAMELFTTTCVWDGPKLTVYQPSQSMWGTKAAVAQQLGVDQASIRVVSRFVGGAFGSKGSDTARTAWIAIAARRLHRPVKLVCTRDQGFTVATYRAETRQHVQLAAGKDGRLIAFVHEGQELTSRPSGYNVAGVESTARIYACPNIGTKVEVVHADRNTPGFMRAPPETPYMFGLESGMDELSYALGIDPIELRRINDTMTDPVDGKPFTSRSLMQCYDQGAARFGWSRRNPKPASMHDGDWLVGMGCATACYPSNIGAAACRLSLTPDGKAQVHLAAHEIGTGAYTTVGLAAAAALGIPLKNVIVVMGDSDLPPVPVAGGSNNAASTVNVVLKACEEVRGRLAAAAVADRAGPFGGVDPARLKLEGGALAWSGKSEPLAKAVGRVAGGTLEVHAENVPEGSPPGAMAGLYKGQMSMVSGSSRKDGTAYAFGAHFVEVRVHRLTREIRTPRVVSAFAAGTIVNPLTAHSQFMGGAIWGVSAALHEATEIDLRTARYVNDNLADYRIPVNADVPSVEIVMVHEKDEQVNPAGIKGIGEVGIVGMNAAVANAVYHATGKRIRDLPITPEKLL
jgi:xanthine dehydrogenase YagR molybdenum-binding subunit